MKNTPGCRQKEILPEGKATIKPENRIGNSPETVEKRLRLGDWEVDAVLGAIGRGGLVSAVDRKSRYLRAYKKQNSGGN